jgi:RNase LS, bacterial toxin DBD domain
MAKSVQMDHAKVEGVLLAQGTVDLTKDVLNDGKLHQYTGNVGGVPFMVKIFVNKDGTCTVGRGSGDAALFEVLKAAVEAGCRYGLAERFEVSIPKFQDANVVLLGEFLVEQGATVDAAESTNVYELKRYMGPRGDTLTVKSYKNKTLQLQGRFGHLCLLAQQFLTEVLSLDEVLEEQRKVYQIPVTIQAVKDELAGRIPAVHDWLEEVVRKQFSSACGLSKVGVELEDYAALAFPALRGLEGYTTQVLRDVCNLQMDKKVHLGEYFDAAGGGFALRAAYSQGLNAAMVDALSQCYTCWNKQRHRLFHVDGTIETTRILGAREEAIGIINEVFALVDQSHARIFR